MVGFVNIGPWECLVCAVLILCIGVALGTWGIVRSLKRKKSNNNTQAPPQ